MFAPLLHFTELGFFFHSIDWQKKNYMGFEWLLEIWPFQDKRGCGKGRVVVRRSDRKMKEESPGMAGCRRYFGTRGREANDRSWWLLLNSSRSWKKKKNWIFSISLSDVPEHLPHFADTAADRKTTLWKCRLHPRPSFVPTTPTTRAALTTTTTPTTSSDIDSLQHWQRGPLGRVALAIRWWRKKQLTAEWRGGKSRKINIIQPHPDLCRPVETGRQGMLIPCRVNFLREPNGRCEAEGS